MRIELSKAEESILSGLFVELSQELGLTKEDAKYFFFQSLVDRGGDLYNELLTSIVDKKIMKQKQ